MSTPPHLYAVPLGADFGQSFMAGLLARYGHLAPEDFARIDIYVNTRRTQRRLRDLFDAGPAMLLPRIRLITDLANDPVALGIPPAASPLRHRLELAQLVGKLLAADSTNMAPQEARFDLADSLADLMAEMQSEGISPDILHGLDVTDQSGHWERALAFVNIVQDYFEAEQKRPGPEARQRQVVEHLLKTWAQTPPDHPVIVAGSTGSRGTTALFMEAVAKLPHGAVVLPGVDRAMPAAVWDMLETDNGGEDHPQFRFKALCDALDCHPTDLPLWHDQDSGVSDRAALVSLALRPAPVTDQWITEGPNLSGLEAATEHLTLIEAPSPRAEATAIAVRLRQAVDEGKSAALITPDRVLARQVTSALSRWHIIPDDSAGIPLQLTPPARFLRHTVALFAQDLTAEALLVLLRHPLCHSGADRGPHNLYITALELNLRRHGPAFPTAESLAKWANNLKKPDDNRIVWATWLGDLLPAPDRTTLRPLSEWLEHHIALTEALAAGPGQSGSGELWDKDAGRLLLGLLDDLRRHADAGGDMTATDYGALLDKLLSGEELRERYESHPGIRIWGTLEARVQSADLVILGGMNEGIWPQVPAPDPWLNRRLRMQAGLLLPERRTGLSAHDFQIAINAPEVVISRAVRSDDAETVASRWVNRLTNLLRGIPDRGEACLTAMTARGRGLLDIARQLEDPGAQAEPAPRPSPQPPRDARPKQLSVTQIKTLIRDPYAIYARNILGLQQLDPLTHSANAALRGNIIHAVLERFIKDGPAPGDPGARQRLLDIAEQVLAEECPWPADQRLWFARIERFVDGFLQGEVARQAEATPSAFETKGKITLDGVDFTLVGKADRIDIAPDGAALIYDYKSGQPPSKPQQVHYDKQLLLEAAMIELGAFGDIGQRPVIKAEFIGLDAKTTIVPVPLDEHPPAEFWTEFTALMQKWAEPWLGYTSRRSNMKIDEMGYYDHLARYGEWDESTPATREDLS